MQTNLKGESVMTEQEAIANMQYTQDLIDGVDPGPAPSQSIYIPSTGEHKIVVPAEPCNIVSGNNIGMTAEQYLARLIRMNR